MKWTTLAATAVVLVLVTSNSATRAEIIKASADAEVGERPSDDRGSGTGDSMNTRIVAGPPDGNGDRNEIMVMRFDLTGIDFNNVTAATLNLIHYRDNTSTRPYIVYGVNDGATGGDNNGMTPGYDDNTWDESAVRMSTMPGLVYDGDPVTQGINTTDTMNLGGGSFISAAEGDVDTLNAPSLLTFLTNHPDDLVTLIVARDPSNTSTGQDRFATHEAAALTNITGAAGDFAPFLNLTVVPEPASLTLLSLCAIALAAWRVRR